MFKKYQVLTFINTGDDEFTEVEMFDNLPEAIEHRDWQREIHGYSKIVSLPKDKFRLKYSLNDDYHRVGEDITEGGE